MSRRAKRRRNASGAARIEWRAGGLSLCHHQTGVCWNGLVVTHVTQFQLSKTFSVGILPIRKIGDVLSSLTSVRHPVGDVAHRRRSGIRVKDRGTLARATSISPRARTGLEISADAAVGYSSLWLRAARAIIMIVYRLHGER
jgi:hypothetical protein